MIKKLIKRMFGKTEKKTRSDGGPEPRIVPVSKHGIRREQIIPCALRVTDGLQQAGFAAFVVGGAVRDLLLGREPKDFDVATDATPDEVRQHFRRSRIIGRRFRIVHVMCGNETVEVSTFRAPQAGEDDDDQHADEHGRLLRDNVWGNMADDAIRRDFTVNALFYDPAKQEVWDYQDGMQDMRKKVLRMIGDPATRYREDPVRMLRAARLAAKLGFTIDVATRAPIAEMADLLQNVPSARLFDEMLKLLLSGHSVECVRQLRAEGLHHGLLPMLDVILEQPLGEKFINIALANTDQRVREDKPVSPGFLFAALLWHEVLATMQQHEAAGMKPVPAMHAAMDDVLDVQRKELAIPRRFDAITKELWLLQPRFLQRGGGKPYRLLSHPRFRAAYDFLLLRCESGEVDREIGEWWTRFQDASDADRAEMQLPDDAPKKKRRRRTKPKRERGADESVQQQDLPGIDAT
ncbi:MAG: polynucleotide adenylyltransferase PcnB [Burkholderiales bacterium]